MIIGLGMDLCEIERVEAAMRGPRFLLRIYTQRERERIAERGASTAAGLFAAKEAVAKALGTGFRGFFADAVEIVPDALGRPECVLHGGALKRLHEMGGARVTVSITHSRTTAGAVAIVEG